MRQLHWRMFPRRRSGAFERYETLWISLWRRKNVIYNFGRIFSQEFNDL
jgi:hypothetical protein